MFDSTLPLQLNGVVPHDNLVLIKMRPDEHGRFGFNVKVRDQPAAKTEVYFFLERTLSLQQLQGLSVPANCLYPLVSSGWRRPEDAHHRVSSGSRDVGKSATAVFPVKESNSWTPAYKPHRLPCTRLHLQADLCVPRLNEGDQVVLINGRDISDHTHDQVVMFIKASCESHSGELILLVRPNGELPRTDGKVKSKSFY